MKAPFVYLRPRLGLYSDQNLDVASVENTPAGTQFETVLQKASSIAFSLDTPVVFSGDGADVIIQPSGALSYTRVDPFVFPKIRIGENLRSAETVFDEGSITAANEIFRDTKPLGEFGVLSMFNVKSGKLTNTSSIFYFGGGYMRKWTLRRGIRYAIDPKTGPIASSLQAEVQGVSYNAWRGVLGFKWSSAIDVRVDIAGPIGEIGIPGSSVGLRPKSLLRIVVGRDFPIMR